MAAVIVFGSGRFFHPRYKFVCFFTGNLNGLKVGAPIKFRGVQIGSVTAIRLRAPGQPKITDVQAESAALPVFIELDQSQLAGLGAARNVGSRKVLQAFIAHGLRAQLATESLLTGLLYVELDFHEVTQPKFVLSPSTKYLEIPTVPTAFQQVQEKALNALAKLDQIDFGALIASLTDAAKSTRTLVGSPELKAALVQVKQTAASMKVAMASFTKTSDRLGAQIDPLMEGLKKTSRQATLTLASAQATLDDFKGTLDPNSPLGYQVIRALRNMSDASQAVAALADYMQRNPSSLLRGKADDVVRTR